MQIDRENYFLDFKDLVQKSSNFNEKLIFVEEQNNKFLLNLQEILNK